MSVICQMSNLVCPMWYLVVSISEIYIDYCSVVYFNDLSWRQWYSYALSFLALHSTVFIGQRLLQIACLIHQYLVIQNTMQACSPRFSSLRRSRIFGKSIGMFWENEKWLIGGLEPSPSWESNDAVRVNLVVVGSSPVRFICHLHKLFQLNLIKILCSLT